MGAKFEIILDLPPDLDNFYHSIVLPPDLYIFREMHNFTPRRIFLVKCIFLPPDRYTFRQGIILPPHLYIFR